MVDSSNVSRVGHFNLTNKSDSWAPQIYAGYDIDDVEMVFVYDIYQAYN